MTTYKLSLSSAILISVNIILGAGVFLNMVPLSQKAGALCPLIYVFVATLMVPLIVVMARLVKAMPGGTLYTFALEGLSQRWGFFVGWSYFVGKLASCSAMIHLFTSMAQQAIPALAIFPQLPFDLVILGLFTSLNLLNMRTGNIIQMVFISMKAFPISFVILIGLWRFNLVNFAALHASVLDIPLAIPLAIYAFTGFEAIVALSAHIKDPERNGPKAIFGAFSIAVVITFLLQSAFYSVLDLSTLTTIKSFNGITAFAQAVLGTVASREILYTLLQLSVGISALGGAYGILFSNNWNLFALAQANTLPFSGLLARRSMYNIAYWCVVVQSLLCLLYLTILGNQQVVLQQINALACTLAYTICVLAYLKLFGNKLKTAVIGYCALATSILFIGACMWGFYNAGMLGLIIFTTLIFIGLILTTIKSRQTK